MFSKADCFLTKLDVSLVFLLLSLYHKMNIFLFILREVTIEAFPVMFMLFV